MEYRRKLDFDMVREFITNQSAETKIYIGGDSTRFKKQGVWYADYTVAVVIHFDGCRGAKVFGEVTRERDYDSKKNRPALRLMTEVYRTAAVFQELREVLKDRYFEIHMDINPDQMHGSSCVLNEAIGYIRGTCNVTPMVKPNAWSASFGADRFTEFGEIAEKAKKFA